MTIVILSALLFFTSLSLETSIIAFPLILFFSIAAYIFNPSESIVLAAFTAGFFRDVLTLSPLGATPIIILVSFMAVEVIKREFDVSDHRLILVILFLASYIGALLFSYKPNIVLYAGLFLFAHFLFSLLHKKKISW